MNYFDGAVAFNPDGSFVIGNGPELSNDVGLEAIFGGMLGFDISFGNDFIGAAGDGSTLAVSLLDAGYGPLGSADGVARFDLDPAGGQIYTSAVSDFATISAVREPSDLLLVMSGLALMGWVIRRKAGAAH